MTVAHVSMVKNYPSGKAHAQAARIGCNHMHKPHVLAVNHVHKPHVLAIYNHMHKPHVLAVTIPMLSACLSLGLIIQVL